VIQLSTEATGRNPSKESSIFPQEVEVLQMQAGLCDIVVKETGIDTLV
jgi:hypothetical protein